MRTGNKKSVFQGLLTALILWPWGSSHINAGTCMSACAHSERKPRVETYQVLVNWCEESFPQYRPYPAYRETRRLRKALEKGRPLSAAGKAGLLLRRLVKQNPSLTADITREILNDPRISETRPENLPEFISVFGMLASTRLGFTEYYPHLSWSEI